MSDTLLILDWGIGGIGAFLEVRKRKPAFNILYWSDSGAVPYGKMTQETLSARVLDVLNAATKLGATHAIIACNAASTILPLIDPPIPTIGVIKKGIEKLIRDRQEGQKMEHIGIIGGARTIDSGAWSQPLIDHGFHVSANIAQPLSAIIESGKHLDPDSIPVFQSVLSGLEDVTDLVLACTHYVVASDVISAILPQATLFDPVNVCVDYMVENWPLGGLGDTRFLTTGNISEMEKSAKLAYNLDIAQNVSRAPKIQKKPA